MRKHLSKKNIIITLAVLFLIAWQFIPKTLTRAAVDVGSGSIKVTVAQIEPFSKKIKNILYSEEHSVPFKRDIQVGGGSQFSDNIQRVALDTLARLKQELEVHNVSEWRGVATAASRQATNAQDLYQRIQEQLDIDISIISQHEEGRLGFATASAVSRVVPEQLIAVDSGSGSFQLTTLIDGELEVIEGALGHIPSLEMLMEIRNQKLDLQTPPAPVTLSEAKLLVQKMHEKMPEVPEAFQKKIQHPESAIVGIGNENFIFAMGATGVGRSTFTKEELWNAIEQHAGKPVEEMTHFSHPNTAVLGMVLLYSIMDAMQIEQLTARHANGSCEGLLIETNYWS